ncbi:MAG TPA: hypothetical protein PLQ99_05355 [Bacilli bacterium]|nr:hypothetical protein [Bacilli bacterium]
MGKFDNKRVREQDYFEKYDMQKKPVKQKWYLKILAWLICLPVLLSPKRKVIKIGMKNVKPPYVLLCNHNAFLDFKVTTKAIFPYSANYVVAIDGFIHREKLLRSVGCICKRKFTNDVLLVRHILYTVTKLKQIVVLYPEARYSLVGTPSVLPDSLGKMLKLIKVPVVVLNMKGHHLDSPFWNLKHRRNRTEATMTKILDPEEIKELSIEEINHKIQEAFIYDEYQWQKDNNIRIAYKKRAEGLHKILYKCPNCLVEYQMDSKDHSIFCKQCGKKYEMDELGQLHATTGKTEFSHIPDWYEWEREEVRKEILAGQYLIEDDVIVDSLPNAKGFIPLGDGHLKHDSNGFVLNYEIKGEKKTLVKDVASMYGCHIELEYNGKGDAIDLSTLDDTFHVYFKNLKNVVTKIHFATEELYKIKKEQGPN